MKAYKCDRCGKYGDGDDVPEIRGWGSEKAKMIGRPTIIMDLCPECYEALQEFLEKGGKDASDSNDIR